MATPNHESIETFMSITGSSELVAVQKLTEHGGNLNESVNAYFTEGDTNIRETHVTAPQEDFMDIDEPSEPSPDINPFSLLDPNLNPHIIGSGRESHRPESDDVIDTLPENIPETRGTHGVIGDDEFPARGSFNPLGLSQQNEGVVTPSAPEVSHLPDYGIEEEMIRAAIEASKRDAEIGPLEDGVPHHRQSTSEDPELAHAVSISLKEQEKAVHGLESEAGPSETTASKSTEVEEAETSASTNGRLEVGGASIHDETEDTEDQPLVRRSSRLMASNSNVTANNHVENDNDFPSDEWGGISSEEHDEAVMLEAAMFGGVPEGSGYRVPRHYMQNGIDRSVGPYPRPAPRPPSPSLTAQRLIREQQDDEYLAALQADREKELQEQAAREAAMEEEQRKLEQEQEIERQLAAKEASLPEEPKSDDENGVTLLVRMPDGTRRGRRFLRTNKLQHLFDFIDIGRVFKPTTYRLVRPYPRRAFSDGESELTLNELGLTSKQEALFLELIN